MASGLVLLAVMTSGQASGADERPADLGIELASTKADDSPAATANGEVISAARVYAYLGLVAQNQRITGAEPATAREILDGLIDDELLYQEAVRRGLEASEEDAKAAVAQARDESGPAQMEFVLGYASQKAGQTVDADTYWAMPEVVSGFRHSLSVQALIEALSHGEPAIRESAVAGEKQRLRTEASITISAEFR
ncbi:MAG: hypothetical protein AB7N24_02775 [Dehalococcoidia bacterium]